MSMKLSEATQAVIDEFMELAKIPRKSGYEEAVSKYLHKWAVDRGFYAVRDEVNNVIIDRPAGAGCEHKPLTILQGHMDMVCVGAEGYPYDPLKDSIKVINHDDETLTAYQTSLGADDGIGVAIAQYILTHGTGLGPLRVVFTVNEEELMLGAKELAPRYLDAKYLINLDSENDAILTNSSAGGMSVILSKIPKAEVPVYSRAIAISLTGLKGGHSGVEINTGRLNAVRAVCFTLLALDQAGVHYELCSVNGGTADNAIPSACTAVIVVKEEDMPKFNETFCRVDHLLHETYDYIEKGLQYQYSDTEMPSLLLSAEDKNSIITCATQVVNGVHTMSPIVSGLVQSSSNLGIFRVDAEYISISVYWRSSDELFIEQLKAQNTALADMTDMKMTVKSKAPGWPVNPESSLVPLVKAIYKEQTGEEMSVEAIHAGLECSWFYDKNPKLDLISVGPNLTGVHSPAETLQIASIPKTLNLVLETLRRI